jgi:hypothetical protein
MDGAESYDGELVTIRYEDFVDNASQVLSAKILPFLGIAEAAVHDRMKCALAASIPSMTRIHTYTFEFSSADREAVLAVVGEDVLKKAGYT